MGMFDYIRCKFPLPLPEFQGNDFQTKDTPAQWLDLYEIHAGTQARLRRKPPP